MRTYFSLVKFAHTVFALPFALTGFSLAIAENPAAFTVKLLALVLLCMVFARNAAMAFNRWLDRDIDAANPRTQNREIPAGVISARAALGFVLANAAAFIFTTWFINLLCFALSPVALLVILGYSYTKRFTWLCHLVLGLGLSLAPIGAYLAVSGHFELLPVLYGCAVLTWVAGFDIIYALQDDEFDRSQRLYSMPSFFGKGQALRISEVLHVLTAACMVVAARLADLQFAGSDYLLWLGTAVFLGLLFYQHRIVSATDLSRVNAAFFTTNGMASVVFGVSAILSFLF